MPLRTASGYKRELDAKKTERTPLDTYWWDSYEFTFPVRGQKFISNDSDAIAIRSAASADAEETFDSTAKVSIKLLASAIMSGMFPAHVLWLALELRNNDDKDVKEWLEETSKTIWKNIHASNFDVVGYESLIDLIVSGMFAIFIMPGTEESGQPYKFEQWPLASIYCSDSTGGGVIDTVYREFKLTAEQAVNTYEEDKLHIDIINAAKSKPSTKFNFLHVIHPLPDHKKLQLPIASVHIDLKHKKIVRKDKGFHEMPVVIPRWFVIPESVYATGPVDDALPDIRTINELTKIYLAALDLAISGMWGAVDDGIVNPNAVTVGPRKVIPVANKDSFFPLNSGVDINASLLSIEKLQAQIKDALMTTQLSPHDGPVITATEAHINLQLLRQQLGPMYGRLQTEMADAMVKRCFGIALRGGALGPVADIPEAVMNQTANIKYTNPLAKAQKLEELGAIERFEAGIFAQAGAGLEESLDIYKIDDANREKADNLGVPETLMRTEDEVKTKREDREAKQAEAIKAAQEHELQKGAITKSGGNNA